MSKLGKVIGSSKNMNNDFSADSKKVRTMPTKVIITRLLKFIGKKRFILYSIFAVVVLSSIFHTAKPYLVGKAIDCLNLLYADNISFTELSDTFYPLIVLFLVTTSLGSLMQYLQGYLSGHLNKSIIYTLRKEVYSKLIHLPLSYTEEKSHGDLMSRVVNDTENISNILCQSLASFFSSLVNIISVTAVMLYISPLLTLIIYIFVPLSVFFTKFLSRKMRQYFKKKHEILGKLEGNIEENTYGYETLLAYNQREKMAEKFYTYNEEYVKYSINAGVLSNFINPLLTVLSGIAYVAILFVGALMTIKGTISIGTIQTFLLYIRQITQPLNSITSLYAQIQTALASAERFFEIYDATNEDNEGTLDTIHLDGEIKFENINFAYKPDTIILEDFNLHIKAGQKIGIVGETGSGKTTIINMIMRFYPYQSGLIRIDGEDISHYTLKSLRKNITLVPQDTFFFSGTIKDNISYGLGKENKNQIEEIIHAAKCANAHDFILQLPQQYDTILSREAGNLSAGQKQLLALARAFMKDSPILILDEATANIDTLTEMQIQNAILSLMENRTCLVIAHRLSTIVNMDRIIMLDKGKIIESGSHAELLALKGHYYTLYSAQAKNMELI